MSVWRMPALGEQVKVKIGKGGVSDGDEYLHKHNSQTGTVSSHCKYAPHMVSVKFPYQANEALVHVNLLRTIDDGRFKPDHP